MNSNETEKIYQREMPDYFERSLGSLSEKFFHFPKYISRQSLARFLFKYEVFKKILDVHGSIIECGVYMGGGTMSFAHASVILEPYNHQRKIYGFDTFEGFPEVSKEDLSTAEGMKHTKAGVFNVQGMETDLNECVRLFDCNRPLGHLPKIKFIKGDITRTLPEFLQEMPHIVVALLYLDLDLYKPTKTALELLIPRIPKGGIIVFDELNHEQWPGETMAVMEVLGLNNLRLQRFPFEPVRCFAVVE